MKKIRIKKEGLPPLEMVFGKIKIECGNEYCGKSFDALGEQNLLSDEEIASRIKRSISGVSFFGMAVCPYCHQESLYSYELEIDSVKILAKEASENIISIACREKERELLYVRDPNDPTDDSGFNFTCNINSHKEAFFYNRDDDSAAYAIFDAFFVTEGDSCIVDTLESDHGISIKGMKLYGPVAILEEGLVITSNKNAFVCEEVYMADGKTPIAPIGDPELFKNKIVACCANSPRWTRSEFNSGGGDNG